LTADEICKVKVGKQQADTILLLMVQMLGDGFLQGRDIGPLVLDDHE
jgi:hypothetical protein